MRTFSVERGFSRCFGGWDVEAIVESRGMWEEAERCKGCGEMSESNYRWAVIHLVQAQPLMQWTGLITAVGAALRRLEFKCSRLTGT